MTVYQHPTEMQLAVDALRKDLLRDDGPQISTVRNYNFAILPYDPEHEFALRGAIQHLCEELRDAGWNTGIIPLHGLLRRADGVRLMNPLRLSRLFQPRVSDLPESWNCH